MHWSSLFSLFYILSLRISMSAIINIYFMNMIIWSWVHSRLRGMRRLIRDKSGSGSALGEGIEHEHTRKCTASHHTSDALMDYELDWWILIYYEKNHCLFRRSLFSITLISIAVIFNACLIQEIISVNDDNDRTNKQILFDTSVIDNSLYRLDFILPICFCYIVSCLSWILAIFVENKKTFVMDLCEKEAARLLKMIGIGYIITQAIFIPTLMVNPLNATKPTRDVCASLNV